MGSFNQTCGVSQLPIQCGDPVALFLVVQGRRYDDEGDGSGAIYNDDYWSPRSIQLYAEYADYGWYDNFKEDWNHDFTLRMLREQLRPRKLGKNEYHDQAVDPEKITNFGMVGEFIHSSRLQINNEHHYQIGKMAVHRSMFDALVKHGLDTWSEDLDVASLVASGKRWLAEVLEIVHNTAGQKSHSGIPYDLGSLFLSTHRSDEKFSWFTYNHRINEYNVAPLYKTMFLEMLRAGEDIPDIMIEDVAKFVIFQTAFSQLSKPWMPQISGGQEYDRKLRMLVIDEERKLVQKEMAEMDVLDAEEEAWMALHSDDK